MLSYKYIVLHTYILLLGFVFTRFRVPTVSLSAILGGLHVRCKTITYALTSYLQSNNIDPWTNLLLQNK